MEADTHFPTDYRSLYESGRKCSELIARLAKELEIKGWRQYKANVKRLKGYYRHFGRITRGGGKNKQQRKQKVCAALLTEARKLSSKIQAFRVEVCAYTPSPAQMITIDWFYEMLTKHIDLLERRVMNGEVIAHEEKVFSIFQPYVEWIEKGKRQPEIGKKVFITSDQYHLILDYRVGEKQQDSEIFTDIVEEVDSKYPTISTWSTDKGFSTQANKEVLRVDYAHIRFIMPKRGKKNKTEQALEADKSFVKLRNKHSAIESNINELEHRGLDRCPERSALALHKYVGLAVIAYNLHRIGRKLSQKKAIQLARQKQATSHPKAA